MNPPAASRSNEASASFRRSVLRNLPLVLTALWIAGALFFLARWRMHTMRLAALVRRAGVLTDSGWNAQVRALSADLGIDRHVALLVSDEIEVPITTGVMFPRVVLSLDYPEWSPTRRAVSRGLEDTLGVPGACPAFRLSLLDGLFNIEQRRQMTSATLPAGP